MINNFVNSEPEWHLPEDFSTNQLTANINNWLSEPGSLTQRIKGTFFGDFLVSLQGQGQSRVFSQDASQLEIGQNQEAFVREVFLIVSERMIVFARTTVPNRSLKTLDSLTQLGNKPLGEVIFSYPDLERQYLHFAKIPRSHLTAYLAQYLDEQYLWARRNTYKISGQMFLVSEFFLPHVFEDELASDYPAIVSM